MLKRNNGLKKSSNLDIYQEEDFQTSSKILDTKILGGENYQTSPENINFKILEEGNYQTFSENFNPRIIGGTFPNFPGKFYSCRLRGVK